MYVCFRLSIMFKTHCLILKIMREKQCKKKTEVVEAGNNPAISYYRPGREPPHPPPPLPSKSCNRI